MDTRMKNLKRVLTKPAGCTGTTMGFLQVCPRIEDKGRMSRPISTALDKLIHPIVADAGRQPSVAAFAVKAPVFIRYIFATCTLGGRAYVYPAVYLQRRPPPNACCS